MIDYSIYYRDEMPLESSWDYHPDVFISFYNPSDRVCSTFERIDATSKFWIVQKEYDFKRDDYPQGNTIICNEENNKDYRESDFCYELENSTLFSVLMEAKTLCIDFTGVIKPYMMAMLAWLTYHHKRKFDVLFSEPKRYKNKDKTKFAGDFYSIREVAGYAGIGQSTGTEKEVLVIGPGYDYNLISAVAEHKKNAAKKIQLLGFPSLRADMYQENVLCISKASGADENPYNRGNDGLFYLAPANDPFATAAVLHEIYEKIGAEISNASWYLCPLATKAQALGFCIFFIKECKGKAVSIIYPLGRHHEQETGEGVARTWKYTVEL
ncbi:MAG: hypothetical protein AB7F40_05060 [Victivallaceae bacterium]